jgi:hypothetical protein
VPPTAVDADGSSDDQLDGTDGLPVAAETESAGAGTDNAGTNEAAESPVAGGTTTGDAPDSGDSRDDVWPRREPSSRQDYWDAFDDAQLAGQVYPVETADGEGSEPAYQPQARSFTGDDAADSARPPRRPELDDDAPPFATAPFATVPRLNRVRATPIPPVDDDEDGDDGDDG